MIKHTHIIRRLLPTNYLSVFNHFVGLVLQGLTLNTCSRVYQRHMKSLPLIYTYENFSSISLSILILFVVNMQNIYNLARRNSVHITDKFLIATIQISMACKTHELGGKYKTFQITLIHGLSSGQPRMCEFKTSPPPNLFAPPSLINMTNTTRHHA